MSSNNCIDVALTETKYNTEVANEYVVLAFFISFLLAAIIVIIFVKYVMRLLTVEREREKHSMQRKSMRIKAAQSMSQLREYDPDTFENVPLQTNYISTRNELPLENNEQARERSHSRISLVIEEGTVLLQNNDLSSSKGANVLDILATLFTSCKSSLPPTIATDCFQLLLSCFEMSLSFHREAFLCLIELMLCNHFEERKINETEKLIFVTKYEQMLDDPVKQEQLQNHTNKLHFILVHLENEVKDLVSFDKESSIITGERLSKYLSVIQRELLGQKCEQTAIEVFVKRELGLMGSFMNKWFNLEITRYRLSVVFESVEGLLKKKRVSAANSQKYLNGFIANVYEKLNEFCCDYEKDLFELTEQAKGDIASNKKQALMELESKRAEQRTYAMQGLNFSKKKIVSKFVIAQIDSILSDFKMFLNYEVLMESDSLELFAEFQRTTEKKLVRLLKGCEESLFEKLQQDEVLTEENLTELGKTMSINLKDFKTAQVQVKNEVLVSHEKKVSELATASQSVYSMLEKKFTRGIEVIKNECLEILHSLSNLQEDDMNQLEHEFQMAFASLNFCSFYNIMSDLLAKIHENISSIVFANDNKDMSCSLHDMVQVLKQDRTVINKSTLFQIPKQEVYLKLTVEVSKMADSLTPVTEGYLEAISNKMKRYLMSKVVTIVQKTSINQSCMYVSNLNLARDKILSCSTDSRGYTAKLGSSMTRNCFEKVQSICESQATFKAYKCKEEKNEIMRDFAPICEEFFGANNTNEDRGHMESSFVVFHKCLTHEFRFFEKLEKLVRSNSVERVLDSNLENEIMVLKLQDKLESLELQSTFDRKERKGSKRRMGRNSSTHKEETQPVRVKKDSLRRSLQKSKKL
eukprot:Seg12854.1 transcript_id=Seg12854.1/GoldUCD/mRNA.D3Y31 product="hypothetical protein" protein_id=Seg12854.1/GoldUCD/D3Y31